MSDESVFEKLHKQMNDDQEETLAEVREPLEKENDCCETESDTNCETVKPEQNDPLAPVQTPITQKEPSKPKKKYEKKEKTTPSTQVWLSERQRSVARQIGNGKISVGIKKSLEYYENNNL